MRPEDVTFRFVEAEIESVTTGDQRRAMEVVEFRKPDGNLAVLPADAVNEESGKKYYDLFPAKYRAFKDGVIDPDRADQLQREINERQAELDRPTNTLVEAEHKRQRGDHGGKQGVIVGQTQLAPRLDKGVPERSGPDRLGHGRIPDPVSARSAADHRKPAAKAKHK